MTDTRANPSPARDRDAKKPLPARISLFYRQVIAELRKVIWPTRKELITYTTVVVVFVSVMTTIVSLLDIGFAKVVLKVFG
jgi:preprotein translocase subunit SecE